MQAYPINWIKLSPDTISLKHKNVSIANFVLAGPFKLKVNFKKTSIY